MRAPSTTRCIGCSEEVALCHVSFPIVWLVHAQKSILTRVLAGYVVSHAPSLIALLHRSLSHVSNELTLEACLILKLLDQVKIEL